MLEALVKEIEETMPEVEWGISVRVGNGEPVESRDAGRALRTASVGKVLLLIAIAEAIEAGEVAADERLDRSGAEPVADSGLWQHFAQHDFAIADLARLVGSVSDNLATNVLIERVGLEAVERSRRRLGLEVTRLLDLVRDERTAEHPEATSVGSAHELRALFERLRDGSQAERSVDSAVFGWLRPSCDLSMVASAFNLDPLAHVEVDRGITVVNKTGTTSQVRADVGYADGNHGAATYAVIANWAVGDHRDAVMGAMRELGDVIRSAIA